MTARYAANTEVPTDRSREPQYATLRWSERVTPQLRFAVYLDWHVERDEAVADQWGYEISHWDAGCYNVEREPIRWGFADGVAALAAAKEQVAMVYERGVMPQLLPGLPAGEVTQ